MPVYNAAQYLERSLESILAQDFTDWELIAINDGSSDGSKAILEEYAANEPRVKLVNQTNKGVVGSLNAGLKLANGEYIARADADDICLPGRLSKQVELLDSEPATVMTVTDFEVIDEDDNFIYNERAPLDDFGIRRAMYIRNPIGHGTVMFRKSAVDSIGGYSNKYGSTEDFALWIEMAKKGEIRSTGTPGYRWRINAQGLTATKSDIQKSQLNQQLTYYWDEFPPKVVGSVELRDHYKLYVTTLGNKAGEQNGIRMLKDNTRLAIKLIKRGQPANGIKQGASVFMVGSCGRKATFSYILTIIKLQIFRKNPVDLMKSSKEAI
jgi:glycosyltransferase involved in cell wall biosynthesis